MNFSKECHVFRSFILFDQVHLVDEHNRYFIKRKDKLLIVIGWNKKRRMHSKDACCVVLELLFSTLPRNDETVTDSSANLTFQ